MGVDGLKVLLLLVPGVLMLLLLETTAVLGAKPPKLNKLVTAGFASATFADVVVAAMLLLPNENVAGVVAGVTVAAVAVNKPSPLLVVTVAALLFFSNCCCCAVACAPNLKPTVLKAVSAPNLKVFRFVVVVALIDVVVGAAVVVAYDADSGLLLSATSFPAVAAAAAAKPNLNCGAAGATLVVAVPDVVVVAAVALAGKPNINLGTSEVPVVSALAPGFSCSQQMHLLRLISFCAMHASQFQLLDFCAAISC